VLLLGFARAETTFRKLQFLAERNDIDAAFLKQGGPRQVNTHHSHCSSEFVVLRGVPGKKARLYPIGDVAQPKIEAAG